MRLLSFHADGFGILAQTGAEDLGPGINIFLGDNEAGKSTCLAFLRAMLTGYPSGRKERQAGQPLRGGQAGGSLTLESGPHGLLHLHRRPGPGSGRLQLTGPDGTPVPENLLEQLFRGIDRQVYRNVFGFSLGELQRFESLDDEAVRHALYGASFGTGLRSPADVLRALQQQADAVYRPQGRKLPLNVQTGVWQELRVRIRQADAQSSRYDALCAQWQQRRQELENLRHRKTELETSLRRTERRLSVWEQWREWHLLGMQLERLSGLPQDFPPQGRERLARLREREEERRRAVQALREQCARTRDQLRELCPDQALAAALPRLRALTEQSSTYRQALTDLPLARLRKEQLSRRLQEELSRLGPDWDCARIRATDRSVFGREELERQAAALATCTTALRMARQREDEAAAALAQAEETHQGHQQRLEALPDRRPPLDSGQQRHLQRLLENWQEKQDDLPRWQRRQQRAREAFCRACAPLHLEENDLAGPERLLRHRDEALSLASRLGHLEERLRSLREQQGHTRQEQEKLQQRERALVQAIDHHPAPEQETLERFAAAVRHCRTLRAGIAAETVRQESLTQQARQLARPLTGGSLPLICMGIVLLLPGLALLLAGQWAPDLIPWPELASSPWAGGLATLCGLALLAGGMPRAGKAEHRRREEAERVRQLLEESSGRLRAQQHRLAHLPLTRSTTNDIPDADELEARLEKQQGLRRQLDQLLQEHDRLRQELRSVRQTLARLATQEQELLAAVQEEEKRWQAILPAATATAFAPAAAGLLFERAATAATLAEALRTAEDDAGHAASSLQQTEQDVRELLALLPSDAACPGLPEAVRRGLALLPCRQILPGSGRAADRSLPDPAVDLHDLFLERLAGIGGGATVGKGGFSHGFNRRLVLLLRDLTCRRGRNGLGNVHFLVEEVDIADERPDGRDLVEVVHAENARHVAVLAHAGGILALRARHGTDAGVVLHDVGEQDGVGASVRDVEARAQLMRHAVVQTQRCRVERQSCQAGGDVHLAPRVRVLIAAVGAIQELPDDLHSLLCQSTGEFVVVDADVCLQRVGQDVHAGVRQDQRLLQLVVEILAVDIVIAEYLFKLLNIFSGLSETGEHFIKKAHCVPPQSFSIERCAWSRSSSMTFETPFSCIVTP